MENFLKTLSFFVKLLIFNFLGILIALIFICVFFKNPQKYLLVLISLSYLITFILIYYFPKSFKNLLTKQSFKIISFKNSYYISLFGIGFSIILLALIFYFDDLFPSYNQTNTQILDQSSSIVNLICSIILIPICEEIMFRGIIFNFFRKNYSLTVSIILQALLFGISHGNFLQGIYTFIGGIILALIYVYCDSNIGNMLLHIIFNLCGSLVIPKLLFIHESINYLLLIIGVIIFIFSSLKILFNYKTQNCINKM
ncbi:type II CAAX endopeptidase family protein [Paraclostridium sordellii]|uniref:type II CAAX endopeptidase family protein n=1 Tax=Paraclostridium sordellii TaxID=1505 RepID=UPI0005DCEC30|nr:CAAX amino terminal protease family protein [[Clostridium] sordellii] [Paeniclostridium sordellii]CEN23873.1 CAAX amino terminal protease family protein [[Clostridium] sordellii] [Paeniclostridium sordellii]